MVSNESWQVSSEKKDAKDQAAKPAATPQSKQLKIGSVDFSGTLRFRVENYGWFETPGFEHDYTFGAAVLRLSFGQQQEKFDWLIEGEFPLFINLPGARRRPSSAGTVGSGRLLLRRQWFPRTRAPYSSRLTYGSRLCSAPSRAACALDVLSS